MIYRFRFTYIAIFFCNDNDKQHSSFKYSHLECQYLSTDSMVYMPDEAVIVSALPRMMATEIW